MITELISWHSRHKIKILEELKKCEMKCEFKIDIYTTKGNNANILARFIALANFRCC